MRFRERESGEVPPLYCGAEYQDTLSPYGDGPWSKLRDIYYSPSWLSDCRHLQEWTWDELHPGPPYLTGGPFDNWTLQTDWPNVGGHTSVSYWRYKYEGGFVNSIQPEVLLSNASLSPSEDASWGDVTSLGATGWSRFRPGRPRASLGQFLGEIRDIPRTLKTTAKGFADLWKSMGGRKGSMGNSSKKLSDHWLNTQFGWLPFLNDLNDFYTTAIKLEERLDQMRRENGRWVKRGGTIRSDTETEEDGGEGVYLYPALNTLLYRSSADGPYGTWQTVKTTSQVAWFEGKMRFYIPAFTGNSISDKARQMAHIYGLTPGPSLVWELTPWSWLIDWVSNIGDCISNIDASLNQGAAAKYAYVMGTTQERVDVTASIFLKSGPVTLSNYASATRKTRRAASPFGFGLDISDLTGIQWSILGALGLSRLKF